MTIEKAIQIERRRLRFLHGRLKRTVQTLDRLDGEADQEERGQVIRGMDRDRDEIEAIDTLLCRVESDLRPWRADLLAAVRAEGGM